jgi:hypothetical protein
VYIYMPGTFRNAVINDLRQTQTNGDRLHGLKICPKIKLRGKIRNLLRLTSGKS